MSVYRGQIVSFAVFQHNRACETLREHRGLPSLQEVNQLTKQWEKEFRAENPDGNDRAFYIVHGYDQHGNYCSLQWEVL